MKKLFTVLCLVTAIAASAGVEGVIVNNGVRYIKDAGAAQYGGSDYKNAIRVERGISLDRAFEIANNDPEIAYFFHMYGWQMVLNIEKDVPFDPNKDDPLGLAVHTPFIYDSGQRGIGYCRIFRSGDAVFFKKEGRWLGAAHGYADTYIKEHMY